MKVSWSTCSLFHSLNIENVEYNRGELEMVITKETKAKAMSGLIEDQFSSSKPIQLERKKENIFYGSAKKIYRGYKNSCYLGKLIEEIFFSRFNVYKI